MKPLFTFSLLAMLNPAILNAQDFVQVAIGASYANQVYYRLSDDATTTLANEAWDLAFTTSPDDAGVFYNEASRSSMAAAAPELRLYLSPTAEFSEDIELFLLTDSLYNDEVGWHNGAFNNPRNESDPDDYGWGAYNAGTQAIEGNRVYALKLRNDTWRKVFIESLANGVYTLKYATLEGASETTVTIDKADFAGSPFALFSFGTGTATASPANWDLLFTRYRSALDPGSGEVVQYEVTGVLSGPGVEVAEARDVDPLTVDYEPYLDSLDSRLDVIGQDWKYFDLGNFTWVLDLNRAFFVKTAGNRLWKVIFYGFEGSSNGRFTFEKTDLGLLSGVEAATGSLSGLTVFPNPAADKMTVAFTLKEGGKPLGLYLVNSLGQVAWQSRVSAAPGLNVLRLQPVGLAAGVYSLILDTGGDMATVKVAIR